MTTFIRMVPVPWPTATQEAILTAVGLLSAAVLIALLSEQEARTITRLHYSSRRARDWRRRAVQASSLTFLVSVAARLLTLLF